MDFLGLSGKTILVMGVANKKSVGFHVGRVLEEAGARVLYSVRTEERKAQLAKLLGDRPVFVCDVEKDGAIEALGRAVTSDYPVLHGIVHSLAFANYSKGFRAFHQTDRADFLQAVNISAYSLIKVAEVFKDLLDPEQGSVVAISISTTTMAAENYGYMAPVKAALDSSVVFLAKSFSTSTKVRFNAVRAGLLKTSSSAGIPGYAQSYLYSEKVIPRGFGVTTEEVAHTTAFLLSPRSSGINAQGIVVDAGMSINYFDKEIVRLAMRPDSPEEGP